MQRELRSARVSENVVEALWNVKECARFLGKSVRWVWMSLARHTDLRGSIPHHRVGKSPRFVPEEVRAWVRAGCPPAAEFARKILSATASE